MVAAVMQNCFTFIWVSEWMQAHIVPFANDLASMFAYTMASRKYVHVYERKWVCVCVAVDVDPQLVPPNQVNRLFRIVEWQKFYEYFKIYAQDILYPCSNWKFNLSTLFACIIRNNIYTTLYTILYAVSVCRVASLFRSFFSSLDSNFKWLPATLCL